ncbi:MAG: tRNA guanosine(34) transglycosylase Tgt, partial [Synechococcus sp. LacPavin_0920_WC12_MAG_50_7]|nr:tRNA guanosine(34) transglycosylase Tgt [Synechococcus sp. LacPavin_0920_WC12_MAG_50_7]
MTSTAVPFSYEVLQQCPNTQARIGRFYTPHGVVETPRFMPVGTAATVKGISMDQLK